MRLLPVGLALLLIACGGSSGADDPDAFPTGRGVGSSTSEVREQPSDEPLGTDVRQPDARPASPPSTPAPRPDAVSVAIDGVPMTIDKVTLWAPNAVNANEYDLFLAFHGAGAPSGTDVAISAVRSGAGCKSGENFLAYRPQGDTQYMPAQTATCGFSVAQIPSAAGLRFTGSFEGTLTSINVTPAKTRKVSITFDVLRAK